MKKFNRKEMPENIVHNGQTYYLNVAMSSGMTLNNTPLKHISAELKKQGRKAVLVILTNENLKGKLDLHQKPDKPTEWLFTTNAIEQK